MSKKFLFLCSFAITVCCFSQERDYIFGQVVDSTQNEPIAFATIKIKDRALGVISNIDGTFKIPRHFKDQGGVLEISCLGYETKYVSSLALDVSKDLSIRLRPIAFELSEAIVSARKKTFSAKQIVKTAVRNIPQNYPQHSFNLVGYYRDYQVRNSSYINLNEAIIRVMDQGFTGQNSLYNQNQLLSYARNEDFAVDRVARQPYDYEGYNKIVPNAKMKNDGGNEFILLSMHDPIRNHGEKSFSFIDNIKSDFVRTHQFSILRKMDYSNESIYQIEITYLDDHYRANGMLFINTADFSIHKLDYALHKLNNESFKKKKNFGYRNIENSSERFSDGFRKMKDELLYRIQTEYSRGAKRKMYLNYISFYNKMLVQKPAEFRSKFVIDSKDRTFRVRLNKVPTRLEKIQKKDFKISYKNERIPIEKFYFLDDERTFVIYPDLNYPKMENLFKNFNYDVADVTYKYEFRDIDGNKLDVRKWEYLHQYREFFIQKVEPEAAIIDEKVQMLKMQPLDSPEQPISGEGIKDYWKNTPLLGGGN